MNVSFIVGTLGRGGAERQLIYMLRALKREGIKTRVLCLTKGEALEREILDLEIDIDYVGRRSGKIARLGSIIASLKNNRADVLQSSHFYTNIYAALAGRVLGIPSIGAIRNDLSSEIAANGRFGQSQFRLPRRLIANSETAMQKALLLGRASSEIDFVKNVVAAEPNGNAPGKNGSLNVLFVGRLVEQKRPEWFVEIAADMRTRFPEKKLKFTVAGDGGKRPQIEALAARRGLTAAEISFLGEFGHMPEIYRSADMLIMTSRHEGTPNAVLEAMAYGLPVAATRVGGAAELLADGRGLLAEPSDFEQLATAACQLVADADLRAALARAGKKFVAENHSLPYLQKRLGEIYAKTLGQRI